jgi:hypothetical protein
MAIQSSHNNHQHHNKGNDRVNFQSLHLLVSSANGSKASVSSVGSISARDAVETHSLERSKLVSSKSPSQNGAQPSGSLTMANIQTTGGNGNSADLSPSTNPQASQTSLDTELRHHHTLPSPQNITINHNHHHHQHSNIKTSTPSDTRSSTHPTNAPAQEAHAMTSSPTLNHADSAVKRSMSSPPNTPTTNGDIIQATNRTSSTRSPTNTNDDDLVTKRTRNAPPMPPLTPESQQTVPSAKYFQPQGPLEAPPSLTAGANAPDPSTADTTSATHDSEVAVPPMVAPTLVHRPASQNPIQAVALNVTTISPSPSIPTATTAAHIIMTATFGMGNGTTTVAKDVASSAPLKRKHEDDAQNGCAQRSVEPNGDRRSHSRDDLPLGLRNKKMRPTDCLLFAATLLEDDDMQQPATASEVVDARSGATTSQIAAFRSSSSSSRAPPTAIFAPDTSLYPQVTIPAKIPDPRTLASVAASVLPMIGNESLPEGAVRPKDVDVLCGRGGLINKHPGNIVYRKVVDYNKPFYQNVHKKHRILVSQSIVQSILNFGGRFLILGAKGKTWIEIGYKRAVQKTSQALRERATAPEDEQKEEEDDEMDGGDMSSEYEEEDEDAIHEEDDGEHHDQTQDGRLWTNGDNKGHGSGDKNFIFV